MEQNQLKDWGILSSYNGISKIDPNLKNKETWLVSQAMDEYYWRKS
jgi:hypothetical protein